MKKIILIIVAVIFLSTFVGTKIYKSEKVEDVIEGVAEDVAKDVAEDETYGVFLSLDGSSIEALKGYDTVVIDAEYYTKEQIKELHDNGQTIYSYLNLGSLETFRVYYEEFSNLALGKYENWEEEVWIDVSDKRWQKHIEDIANEYIEKGINGFFIDNCDVYYFNEKEKIYNGVKDILRNLMKKNLSIIINGGDYFVDKYYEENNTVSDVMTGINQETVFSAINFDNGKLEKAKDENKEYYFNYVKKYGDLGIDIYLLEYTTNNSIKKEVMECCKKNKWRYYFSDSIELD